MSKSQIEKIRDRTREEAQKSPHPKNKIAATIWHPNNPDNFVTCTNSYPEVISDVIDTRKKIGNASATVHAETNLMANAAFPTEGAHIFITDPFCPNCAKNMAEAGIARIYLDREGFEKDFFKRRQDEFVEKSLKIIEHAGISVYTVGESGKVKTIYEADPDYIPLNDFPVEEVQIEQADQVSFEKAVHRAREQYGEDKHAVCLAKNELGQNFEISCLSHPVFGYSISNESLVTQMISHSGGDKYSFWQEALNRMMMHLSKRGFTLIGEFVYCSEVPTSREQVNATGYGISQINIGDKTESRDEHGLKAMKTLSKKGVIEYVEMKL
ncbi:MAG: deoxycytidylate deaminase [Pseudomonadota bacterium]